MNKTIEALLQTGKVVSASGNTFDLHSAIDKEEGELLYNTIKNNESIQNALEIGCAYGVSCLYICEALRGRGTHTILDPFQDENWHGIGIENLRREGFDFFEHIAEVSEISLPTFLAAGRTFDFVFIDGVHTFDHCLLDAFYSTRLLNVGGYLALDDCAYPGIERVLQYLLNYPCYTLHADIKNPAPSWRGKLLGYHQTTRLAILQKTAEDERNWDWYKHF
jgi:predicted O-methyltransferase YrrM